MEIPWKKLLNREHFTVGDRGFWPFTYEIKWVDQDGKPRRTMAEGEIRLRVLRKEYIPLTNVSEDPAFVWKWKERGQVVKMTTGARVSVD